METLFTLLSPVLGCSTLLSYIMYRRANRRIKDAEADKAKAEADKAKAEVEQAKAEGVSKEVERLHRQLDKFQTIFDNLAGMEQSHTERMSNLNNTIDSLIDRNRELSQRLNEAEAICRRDKDEITRLTAKLGVAERRIDYLNTWRCERADCQDPRGAKPPRAKLRGLKYAPPAEA